MRQIIIHPNYNSVTLNNDIAIVKLDGKLTFNAQVQPAHLPLNEAFRPDDLQWSALISGWGTLVAGGMSANTLQYAIIPLLPRRNCIQPIAVWAPNQITSNMICGGSPGADPSGGVNTCRV